MTTFKAIRIKAKKHWLNETKRVRYINDNTNSSKECEWQIKFTSRDEHISIFCSLGDWGSNLTDLLSDYRYDKLDFENESHRSALFRYYTRILLISSEILTDFQDLIMYLNDIEQPKARNLLNDPCLSFKFYQLLEYINNVCKHKFGNYEKGFKFHKYHLCNHHIDYEFRDSESYKNNRINLSVLKVDFQEGSKVEVLSLIDIINQILFCYQTLDKILQDSALGAKSKLKPFTKTNL